MIPSVPFSLLAGLLLGLLFAWAARSQFRDGRAPWGRELNAVASYQLLIRCPLLIYFFLAHRAWSFLFTVDPGHLPAALLIVLLPLDAAALAGGYIGGWALLRRRGEGALSAACAGAGLVLLSLVALLRERLFHDGDYASFHSDPAHAAGGGRLPWLLLVATLGAGAGAWAVYQTLVFESRRKASAPAA